jgi:hypothetical protein
VSLVCVLCLICIFCFQISHFVHRQIRHTDDSELTLNICLGKAFEGGNVVFGAIRDEQVSDETVVIPEPGRGILHVGRQFHEVWTILNMYIQFSLSLTLTLLSARFFLSDMVSALLLSFGPGLTRGFVQRCALVVG